jgi:hypothetical protein
LSPESFFFFFKHLLENRNSGELAMLSWSLPPGGTELRNKVLYCGGKKFYINLGAKL